MVTTLSREIGGRRYTTTSFEQVFQQAVSMTGGGSPNVADLGPPLWRGKWATTALSDLELGEWEAFFSSLRGGMRTFRGRPSRRWFPAMHANGWSDTPGALTGIAVARDAVTLNDLPVGTVLSPGDYVSIPVGSRQHIHRIVKRVSSGATSAVVGVEPTIRPNAVLGVPATIVGPWCDMVLAGPPSYPTEQNRTGRVSFEGLQVIY
jgi:hypothetical protein